MKSGSEKTKNMTAVGTNVDTLPPLLVKGTIAVRVSITLPGSAPSIGSVALKNGNEMSTPAIEPTYPIAVPSPDRVPRVSGGARSGSIAL